QEHLLSRRNFLGGVAAGTLGFAGMVHPASARQLHKEQKHVIVFYLDGGVSQLETWDPKPGTNTGGPFQAIPTSVPGIHISELLPYSATQMHRLAIVRGVNTAEDEHGRGAYIMHTGRRTNPAERYPHLGSVAAKLLAAEVMQQRDIFDLGREPRGVRDQYGDHEFGRHCLLARRLLESGISFVKVTHSNYDTHHENFDFHIEQLGEFDRTFATLLDDLAQRGMLESTLDIVMSEFGRTPKINRNYGRDHWSKAWSIALGGCGIKGGA